MIRLALAVTVFALVTLAACAGTSGQACSGCTGCCDEGKCVNGTSTLACGSNGFACTACGVNQTCAQGSCVSLSNTGGGGGTTGDVHYITGPDGGAVVSAATGDTCGGFAALLAEATSKLGVQCNSYMAHSPRVLSSENCRLLLPACSSADRAQLDLLLNCLRRVPSCDQDGRGFERGVQACQPLALGLSHACQASFYQ